MIYIKNDNNDPHYNLALEEYALKYLDISDDILILWQNEPSVIIGRNQNTIEEINSKYIKDNDINVVRRLSGGGAVYHDFGNLNFTFITSNDKNNVNNYRKFTKPVIDALKNLGVNAEFKGRNDIVVDDKKISGNAQYFYKDKMLHHGTILFNSNLEDIVYVLDVNVDKIKSKGIKSIRSRVTNIYPYLDNNIDIDKFKTILLKSILKSENINDFQYKLKSSDIKEIEELMKSRYLKWEWNYGESPEFNIQKSKKYDGGTIDIRLNVKNGNITKCKIYGDFFGNKDISILENKIINNKFDENNIKEILSNSTLSEYFYNINKEDVIDCMFY